MANTFSARLLVLMAKGYRNPFTRPLPGRKNACATDESNAKEVNTVRMIVECFYASNELSRKRFGDVLRSVLSGK